MEGPVALVGADAFLSASTALDQALLAATGRRRPRVAILPTGAFPDGEAAFGRVAALGEEHFRALGAEVETVAIRDRAAADDPAAVQAIGEADIIYLCGGDPAWLRRTLLGSAAWLAAEDVHRRGATLVGCSAGAAILGRRQVEVGLRRGWPVHWAEALGAAGALAILPAYDARPEPVMALLALRPPDGLPVIGLDRDVAIIGRSGSWEVHGSGRVTVWQGRRRARHRRGDAFRMPDPAGDGQIGVRQAADE